jgi:hypothetical protein
MKKRLLYFVLGVFGAGLSVNANAQAISYVGPRVLISTQTPSAIEGMKDFTYSSDPALTGPWGGAINQIWNHIPLVLADATDSILCTATPGSLTGKWALIWRGDCQFGTKAKKAQQAGATGVMIINNVPGASPINMAAGNDGGAVTIPTLMVSNPDGAAISAMEHTANTVYISVTPYGFNNTHDLCIPNNLISLAPGFAIPKDQLVANNGNPKAYKGFLSAWIANTGTSDEANTKLNLDVQWVPTVGSPSTYYKDSIVYGTLAAADSLDVANSTSTKYDLHATTTGHFDFTYTASSANTDNLPIDNMQKTTMYVTDGSFCNSQYNNVLGEPIVKGGLQVGGNTPPLTFTWGPLFYVSRATQAYNIQMALYPKDTNQHDLQFVNTTSFVTVLFKWTDANSDGLLQPGEMSLVKTGNHTFTSLDSPGKIFVVPFRNDVSGQPEPATLDSNSWYWVAPVLDNTALYLGYDGSSNYYNRYYAADHLASGSFKDFWAPLHNEGVDGASGHLVTPPDTISMIPFAVDVALPYKPSDSMSLSLGNNTPSIALNTFFLPEKVKTVTNTTKSFNVYPNPVAAGQGIHVKLELDRTASQASFMIMDALGRVISTVKKTSIRNDDFVLSTTGLAAGNYYIVMTADGQSSFKSFTVASK